ncbi:MAG: putative ABC transporter substrate-binding protein YesO [Gemmatimonadaceae bacterium]|nr:putative ABC transporter substrate-binding protein YesO [Gemmatimonadaceae bacterium]
MARHALIVAAALLLGACSTDDVIVLRMTSWQSPEENALDLPAVRAFERAHPGVRVVNEPVPNQAEYREKVITNIVSGAPPDVLLLDGIDVPAFVEGEVLLDLAPFVGRVGIDLSWFYPNVLAMFSRGARTYALPKGFSPVVMYYNRAMFDRAGVPHPVDGWTQEEFLSAARALTRDADGDGRPDEWGAVVARPFYAWQSWIWSAGGDVLTPDGTRASGALDTPATDSALTALTNLVRYNVAPRPNAFRAVSGNETRLFYSGKLAMLPSGHWLIPNIKRQLAQGKLRLGVTSTPRVPPAEPATPLFASAWAVPRNTAHRKLAVELAAALAGPEAQRTRLEAGLELSAIPAVQEEFARRDTLGLEPSFLRQVPTGRPPWGAAIARYREVEALLPEIIDRVVISGESVSVVTADVARRIDAILAR